MSYKEILQERYEEFCSWHDGSGESEPTTKQEFLSSNVFNFATYDAEIEHLFVTKALEVCDAISNRTTFEYIKDAENYKWFLIMVNIKFFEESIEWGTSVRGAWWDVHYENGKLENKYMIGLPKYVDMKQLTKDMIEWVK